MGVFFFTVERSDFVIVNHDELDGCVAGEANNPSANKVISMLLDSDNDRRSLMDMVSLISGCILKLRDVEDLFGRVLFFKEYSK